ncbi:hypothetical protein GQ43DRAFT_123729 [Delitschia confertaspora ATCC 74209]|uniref:Uncharacterized protein n=1 Tax=Delitschia confertaspora ATCC 74209 TaxID=1513339 RepID=A0A9P4JM08_9PLEO|nr:hypothetical protein GQ43DRAFT_123729 [Delitschia confertaspora ATCC 74209]
MKFSFGAPLGSSSIIHALQCRICHALCRNSRSLRNIQNERAQQRDWYRIQRMRVKETRLSDAVARGRHGSVICLAPRSRVVGSWWVVGRQSVGSRV